MMTRRPTAIVAEDEPLLQAELIAQLATAWPELDVVARAGNGIDALDLIRSRQPDIAFLDIRMPGSTGLDVAGALAEEAEGNDDAVPLIVFVTAYGEFAVEAFEKAAIDYLLKPVTGERLAQSVARLQRKLTLAASEQTAGTPAGASTGASTGASNGTSAEALAQQLAKLLGIAADRSEGPASASVLRHLRIGNGNTVKLVPVDRVLYFQAADKYVLVMTADGEGLIRESLRELQPRLDPQQFVQIHRSALVNMAFVERAERDDLGRTRLHLRGVDRPLAVSRVYAGLFKAM